MASTRPAEEREEQAGQSYFAGFDPVHEEELRAIAERFARARPDQPFSRDTLSGLALSGGGIRSASFAMGAVQQLHRAGVFEQLHYLSTVSGGGYTGSSLTWFLAMEEEGQACFGVSRDRTFPFSGGPAASAGRSGRSDIHHPQQRRAAGRAIVDFIRQRSSYLLPGGGLGLFSAVAVVARSVTISLVGYLLLFSLLAMLVIWSDAPQWQVAGVPLFFALAAGLFGLFALTSLAYSLFAPLPLLGGAGYAYRHAWQEWAGRLLIWSIGSAMFAVWLALVFSDSPDEQMPWLGFVRSLVEDPSTAAAAGGLGALGGILTRALAKLDGNLLTRLLMPLLAPLSLFLLLVGLGLGGAWLAERILANRFDRTLLVSLIVFSAIYTLYANINLTGLHRFYRDRLMEAFMPSLDAVRLDEPSARSPADDVPLSEMFPARHEGPYHLINTNLVLLRGRVARYRSRGSDSFVLAPLYCGSEATGFVRTADWTPDLPWLIRPVGPITLPTAMAISAAAVNPSTGADGRGPARGATVSMLLTILNLRLGCWLPSPRIKSWSGWLARIYPPNFLIPGLSQGLLGWGRDEDAAWIELTDGGHFDNTGLYELVRRRVRTIYFVDGTEDAAVSLNSFANAAERIYIDFSVQIDFCEPDVSFIDLMRGADPDENPLTKAFELAKNGFAIAKIKYPAVRDLGGGEIVRPAFEGLLYYVKATLTKGLPAPLYSYKAANPAFPAESTVDQFFSERQFEAYRALGFAAAKQLTDHLDRQRTVDARPAKGTRRPGGARQDPA